ncbi:restriction endonuclease subunit S [Psychroflexus planctonicus]|uniref:Type I restriction modification DNA specificity domain-containing protein n=1 Tax=Psychroflexus planctonicus TaxID=1526575 RepID=A0ABQ1SGC9_9FLAO|nr:restriction endonuclease subunit S [Psychroflexus planctonicus]GGE29424.1 hypothetical protein GCM10010832_07440 [Psychroflexus planctonicus]
MRNNYKQLGPYIQQVNERNTDLKVERLLGVSIRKVLMPSIANTVGTNMKSYKIINKKQFAYGPVTSRNGEKISVALLQEYKQAIVSQAYTVFEIINTEELDPEYLMMWFRRPEFDRYARYKSHGSARETFDWDEMCETELPIPPIEKQHQIVAEYNAVDNRIRINEQLNQKLEETAQAIYKHWFVDFEYPYVTSSGVEMPYKSSGGKLVYNEELDKEIPEGWEVQGLSAIATYLNGTAMQKYPSTDNSKYVPVLKIRELNLGFSDDKSDRASMNIPEKYKIYDGDIIFSWSGTLTIDIWTGGLAGLNQHLFKLSSKKFPKWYYYLSTQYYIEEFIRIAEGNKTSMGHIKREHLDNSYVCYPKDNFAKFNFHFENILNKIMSNKLTNNKFSDMKDIILSKMSKA